VAHDLAEACADPVISLLAAVVFAFFALGLGTGFSLAQLQKVISKAPAPIGGVLLILGAGGALKQMLTVTHVDTLIANSAHHWSISPLILAWLTAALLRVALGSATVATAAAAAIVAPLAAANPGLSPELLVLATCSGSVMLSHVNDSGFWLYKEYFQLTVGQTLRTWTLVLCVQSLIGLGGVMILNAIIS
jgi:GntP family gluconate:H+ symporter